MSLKYTADAGSVAEEVISTVRTAQAFGTQRILSALYDGHIFQSGEVEVKASMWLGGGMSCFFFCIYSSYGLGESILGHAVQRLKLFTAFSFGTTLILQGHGMDLDLCITLLLI